MSAYERGLLDQARELDSRREELAGEAVELLGGTRNAGVDPAVQQPLTGAAIALGASSLDAYTASGHPPADEREFLGTLCDLDGDATELLAAASKLADTVTAALDAALADADRMKGEMKAAALARASLCEAALGILCEIDRRLRHAIARMQAAPIALGETYESVYALLRRGGRMPRDGRWITGEDAISPARVAARLPRAPGKPPAPAAARPPARPAMSERYQHVVTVGPGDSHGWLRLITGLESGVAETVAALSGMRDEKTGEIGTAPGDGWAGTWPSARVGEYLLTWSHGRNFVCLERVIPG